MRSLLLAAAAVVIVDVVSSDVFTQSPASGPAFDVVSIRASAPVPVGGTTTIGSIDRPDGGFTATRVPVASLIAQAYPPHAPIDIVGLPGWAREQSFDVSATASLTGATRDDRATMMRKMLADRFGLVVHVENREHDVFDLVLARRDGRLGPGLQPLPDVDCVAVSAARQVAFDAARAAGTPPPPGLRVGPTGTMPPCTLRLVNTTMEGQITIPELALAFTRMATSPRMVIDKTGLTGSYSVKLEFDPIATRRGPDVNAPAGSGPPTLFTAVQEQLGLKLEPSRAVRETLVVDRLERPTEN